MNKGKKRTAIPPKKETNDFSYDERPKPKKPSKKSKRPTQTEESDEDQDYIKIPRTKKVILKNEEEEEDYFDEIPPRQILTQPSYGDSEDEPKKSKKKKEKNNSKKIGVKGIGSASGKNNWNKKKPSKKNEDYDDYEDDELNDIGENYKKTGKFGKRENSDEYDESQKIHKKENKKGNKNWQKPIKKKNNYNDEESSDQKNDYYREEDRESSENYPPKKTSKKEKRYQNYYEEEYNANSLERDESYPKKKPKNSKKNFEESVSDSFDNKKKAKKTTKKGKNIDPSESSDVQVIGDDQREEDSQDNYNNRKEKLENDYQDNYNYEDDDYRVHIPKKPKNYENREQSFGKNSKKVQNKYDNSDSYDLEENQKYKKKNINKRRDEREDNDYEERNDNYEENKKDKKKSKKKVLKRQDDDEYVVQNNDDYDDYYKKPSNKKTNKKKERKEKNYGNYDNNDNYYEVENKNDYYYEERYRNVPSKKQKQNEPPKEEKREKEIEIEKEGSKFEIDFNDNDENSLKEEEEREKPKKKSSKKNKSEKEITENEKNEKEPKKKKKKKSSKKADEQKQTEIKVETDINKKPELNENDFNVFENDYADYQKKPKKKEAEQEQEIEQQDIEPNIEESDDRDDRYGDYNQNKFEAKKVKDILPQKPTQPNFNQLAENQTDNFEQLDNNLSNNNRVVNKTKIQPPKLHKKAKTDFDQFNENFQKQFNNQNENEREENENEENENNENEEQEQEQNEYVKSKEEQEIFSLEPGLTITAKWYYISPKPKKKSNNSDEDTDEESEQDLKNEPEEKVNIEIFSAKNNIILHWGIFKAMFGNTWFHPPRICYPANSKEMDAMAIQTPFPICRSPAQRKIKILIPRGTGFKDYIAGFKFVIFDPTKNAWYNNGGKDYTIKFKMNMDKLKNMQIKLSSGYVIPFYMLDIINCEANGISWTLMHRYNKCAETIENWNMTTPNDNWVWMNIWIRYSFIRQLDWQRNYNTKPADLSNALNKLSLLLTNKYSAAFQQEKQYRYLIDCKTCIIKNILSMLGKGTGNGQEIRDQILNIMHKFNIPENPKNNFWEQWHQKLHNNSTPDDIVICEAVIAFLKTNDLKEYWKVLTEGGVTKQRLASYERKIIDEPENKYNIDIKDFEDYLAILKSVHASTDLIMTYKTCKEYIGDISYQMDDIINNRNSDNVIEQIKRVTECRERLQNVIKGLLNNYKNLREVLFLELSLEIYVRQLVEKIIHIDRNMGELMWEIQLILRNIKVSYPNYKEFQLCYDDWNNIVQNMYQDQSKETSLKVYAAVSRMNRLLSFVVDYYNTYYDEKAKYFGKECKCDKFAVDLFTEELIRGTIFFTLSMLIKKLEPTIRKNAQLGEWLVLSRGKEDSKFGRLTYVNDLKEVQFKKYDEPKVLICEKVGGNEEVPIGCTCLIIIKSNNYPDTLSHISVRARNLGIYFVVCFNNGKADQLMKFVNKNVEVKIVGQEVLITLGGSGKKNQNNLENEMKQKINLVNPGENYKKIFLDINEFDRNCVGAKSNNTKNVYGKIPGIRYPESFAIPFNVFEYFLSLPENKLIAQKIQNYIQKLENTDQQKKILKLLEKCKKETMNIYFAENEETSQLKNRLVKFGIRPNEVKDAFNAIKQVWASKFNERVFIASSKVGVSLNDIKMSVLCQRIIPSEYAFVIHTKNPTNNNKDEVYAEVVSGMGETLVGAYEGQSLSFSYNKRNGNYNILSYPNKNISLRNKGYIFRSDSNFEDIEGFSGAGLFDSVPMVEYNEVDMVYYNEKLFCDRGFIDNMIKKIGQMGVSVEKLYNGVPQDIEGSYLNGDFYIVQTRPQV